MMSDGTELLGIGVGTLLADRYEVEEVLGRGGMGAVFAVRDKALGRELFALKILDPRLATDETDIERFRQEVLITRKLNHPNIVRTFEFGQLKTGQNFVVMEYVRGKSLERMLEESPTGIPLADLIKYLTDMAQGMSYAHAEGVIHRDLKPGNLLVNDEGVLKITDFGLARSTELDARITHAGECVGTPMYMAPEQVQGAPADHRVDIYGLGVVAYELCTGRAPYRPENWFNLANQIVSQPLEKVSRIRSRIPGWFETFVEKCAAKNPELRFSNMDEALHFLNDQETVEPQTASANSWIGERWADALGGFLSRQATVVVIAGIGMFVLVASIGMSKGPVQTMQTQVSTGANAVGKVVDTLSKLNQVVMKTYENSEAIDRFLEEENRKKGVKASDSLDVQEPKIEKINAGARPMLQRSDDEKAIREPDSRTVEVQKPASSTERRNSPKN